MNGLPLFDRSPRRSLTAARRRPAQQLRDGGLREVELLVVHAVDRTRLHESGQLGMQPVGALVLLRVAALHRAVGAHVAACDGESLGLFSGGEHVLVVRDPLPLRSVVDELLLDPPVLVAYAGCVYAQVGRRPDIDVLEPDPHPVDPGWALAVGGEHVGEDLSAYLVDLVRVEAVLELQHPRVLPQVRLQGGAQVGEVLSSDLRGDLHLAAEVDANGEVGGRTGRGNEDLRSDLPRPDVDHADRRGVEHLLFIAAQVTGGRTLLVPAVAAEDIHAAGTELGELADIAASAAHPATFGLAEGALVHDRVAVLARQRTRAADRTVLWRITAVVTRTIPVLADRHLRSWIASVLSGVATVPGGCHPLPFALGFGLDPSFGLVRRLVVLGRPATGGSGRGHHVVVRDSALGRLEPPAVVVPHATVTDVVVLISRVRVVRL